jgi:molybdenum cofactor biosynthesis enzyme MoaA
MSLSKIEQLDFRNEIRKKNMYMRISLTSVCNKNCLYCHNEGNLSKGYLNTELFDKIVFHSSTLGITRIQFTGGEPLLHNKVCDFIKTAKRYCNDIGITTNGILLNENITKIYEAGLNRLHITLNINDFIKYKSFYIPIFLENAMNYVNASNKIRLFINIPIFMEDEEIIIPLLRFLSKYHLKIRLFKTLPNNTTYEKQITDEKLLEIILNENSKRENINDVVFKQYIRKNFEPQGDKCKNCEFISMCKESSLSLRLGSDLTLRPCLLNRKWDVKLNENNIISALKKAIYLTLDY